MLTKAVLESGVTIAEIMDQQCRLVQSLQHQTEYPYRYFSENMTVCSEFFLSLLDGINQALLSY